MKSINYLLAGVVGLFLITSCDSKVEEDVNAKVNLQTKKDSLNYAMGITIANNLKEQGLEEINSQMLAKAFDDVMQEKDLCFSFEMADEILNAHFMELQEKKYEKNKIAGEEFLNANKEKQGVITLPNGIQYEVITEGKGKQATINSLVTTHYHGTLIDGTVFDSSVERGQPAQFPVNGVIMGWQEIIPLMKEGAKWKVYVPQELAYGANPRPGGVIEPYMALIFEIELISVDK
ncbi:MAG: FKBP-type peptidyl-prolyl cis-trans isomerase [Bacteroidota bacterium]